MLKFGYITNYDECGRVAVQIQDEDGFITDYLPIIKTSASKDCEGGTIDTTTLVAVILDDCNPMCGVCLGKVEVMPRENVNKKYHKFSDGTNLEYDREAHILTVDVKGSVNIKAEQTNIDSPLSCTKDVSDKKGTMQAIRDFINNHKHSDGNNGANTGVPTTQI